MERCGLAGSRLRAKGPVDKSQVPDGPPPRRRAGGPRGRRMDEGSPGPDRPERASVEELIKPDQDPGPEAPSPSSRAVGGSASARPRPRNCNGTG